jgi:signal transduction histidine kinase/CheY-like chemotaxis protein
MRKRQIRRWAALFLALLTAALGVEAGAAADESRVIRIPCNFNDFLRVDGEGSVTGYYAEYFEALGKINGWQYEYVDATWSEAVEMLASGEIDLLYSVNYSEERTEAMEYSALSLGYTGTGVFAPADSGYYYEDYAAFDGARIACTRASSNAWELESYAAKHGFDYEIVYEDTTDAVVEAVRGGEADLLVSNATNAIPGCVLVARMDATPVYLTVRKGNAKLMDAVNSGMQQMLKINSELATETTQSTLVGNGGNRFAFTAEEQAALEQSGELTIGFYAESEPLSYVREDGAYGGIYIEILNYLSENSALTLVPYPISRNKNWKELLRNGEIDFYMDASDVVVAKDGDLITTDAFLEYANTLITRSDCAFGQLEIPVIALTYGRANWGDYLQSHLGESLEFQYYETPKECMLAVAQGKADASLLDNLEFNYQSKNPRLSGLIQWTVYRFPTEVSLAASNGMDEALLSAFNNALKLLSSEYVDAVTDECLNMPYQSFSMIDILYNARVPLILLAFALLSTVVILATVRIFRRKREEILREAHEREQHQLRVMAAMSRDYIAIYFIDLDKDDSECMQRPENGLSIDAEGNAFSQALRAYVEQYVRPEYRERLLPLCDPQEMIRQMQERRFISVRYQVLPNEKGRENYELHFADVSTTEGEHKVTFGVRCVDGIVREEMQQRELLQDALNSANAANVAKSEFLSRMFHDIRTPMNAIVGLTVIAQAHADEPERVREALKKISGASQYLLSLINDVLDMSKIESGKLGLTEEDIDLPEMMSEFLSVMQPRVKEHRHNLQVHIQNVRHEAVIGDRLRLQQVFVNLLDNAVKYTPDGGELSLTMRELPLETPGTGCYVFISADNGIGMSREFQKHIFEPFRREEDLRVSKIKGTGLGMSITRNIVQMMNGSIQVESEPGKGTTFTVTVFLKLRESAETDTSELAGVPVLVADDDRDACEALCTMLGEIGMKGTGFCSGQEAVEATRRSLEAGSPYYAAILDWRMPGMDGVETARALKRLTENNLPVIILSAYDYSDIEAEARAAGVAAFLSKPVFKSGVIRLFKTLKDGEGASADGSARLDEIRKVSYAGRRALLVEDNYLNREIAREILEMADLTVEEAEDGQAALNMFAASENGYYDLILMDVQMPVMNGYEATRAIRALERADAASVPIIAMTANAFAEDVQQSREAGTNEHLAKPLNFEKLNGVLRKYLG